MTCNELIGLPFWQRGKEIVRFQVSSEYPAAFLRGFWLGVPLDQARVREAVI